jgi:hypothetical protein
MASSVPPLRPLRILLPEGSSTSARQAVTILGLAGHRVEICDPDWHGLARFSRFVAKFHRCPALRDDPAGFLAVIERLLATGQYDVLLPTHEQGFLFARVQQRLALLVGLALPGFDNYRTALNKARFSRLLAELGLPQPVTRIVSSVRDLRGAVRFPCVIKTAIGTASRGVWFLHDAAGLTQVLQELHAYRQIARGAGGGDAIKESVRRKRVRDDLATIGESLHWHGALSIDYILSESGARPFYIDCNPRLVEPMAADLAGTDLVDTLLRISLGEMPAPLPDSREGVRTHQAMQALLGCALAGGSRCAILRECRDLLAKRGAYADSVEELTPLRRDWLGIVPLAMTALLLVAAPGLAQRLARGGWGTHLLDAQSIAVIERDVEPAPDLAHVDRERE